MWWTAADGGSVVGTAGEEGLLPSCISTRSQLMCCLAVRAILAFSERVQQNSIEGALKLDRENRIDSVFDHAEFYSTTKHCTNIAKQCPVSAPPPLT